MCTTQQEWREWYLLAQSAQLATVQKVHQKQVWLCAQLSPDGLCIWWCRPLFLSPCCKLWPGGWGLRIKALHYGWPISAVVRIMPDIIVNLLLLHRERRYYWLRHYWLRHWPLRPVVFIALERRCVVLLQVSDICEAPAAKRRSSRLLRTKVQQPPTKAQHASSKALTACMLGIAPEYQPAHRNSASGMEAATAAAAVGHCMASRAAPILSQQACRGLDGTRQALSLSLALTGTTLYAP